MDYSLWGYKKSDTHQSDLAHMHDTGGVGGAGAVSPKSVPGGRCGWAGLAWALGMAPQPSQASQLTASLPLAPGRPPGPAAPIGVGLLLFLLPDSSSESRSRFQHLDTILPDLWGQLVTSCYLTSLHT